MTEGPSQGSTRIYSLISTVFLVLTALTLCGVIGYAVANPGASVAVEPTVLSGFPTSTSTLSGPTPPATWTAGPVTLTRSATRTAAPSGTPTPTKTGTPTPTLTPSNTPLASSTPLPTRAPTRAPFDYVIENGEAVYKKNTKFAGCDAVIAGVVEDLRGNQTNQIGMQVHITGNEANKNTVLVTAGDETDYGVSGWEYYFNNHTVERTYGIQLQYSDGTIASDIWQITTNASCNKNLALVTFIQVQARK